MARQLALARAQLQQEAMHTVEDAREQCHSIIQRAQAGEVQGEAAGVAALREALASNRQQHAAQLTQLQADLLKLEATMPNARDLERAATEVATEFASAPASAACGPSDSCNDGWSTPAFRRARSAPASIDLTGIPICSEVLVVSLQAQLQRLDTGFEGEMASLEQQRQLEMRQEFGADPYDSSGGWDADVHLHCVALEEHYRRAGRDAAAVCECIKLEHPHLASAEISRHIRWLERTRYYKSQRKALLHAWDASRSQFLTTARTTLLAAVSAAESQRQRELQDCLQQQKQQQLHSQVDEWKTQQARLKAEADDRERQQLVEQQQFERRLAEREQQRRVELRQRAMYFKQSKKDAARQRDEAEHARNEEAARALQRHNAEAHGRVVEREMEHQAKEAHRRDTVKRALSEQQQRRGRIIHAAEQLAPRVQRDRERLAQETASWRCKAGPDVVPGAAPLFDPHSYHEEDILKDTKFRVMEALREAGMLQCAYGREVLRQVQSTLVPRPDMFGQELRAELFAKNHPQ
eukprot:TRINITY_DN576_c0_g1_i5.p2 TRINITY_DN576_c0_g1~~TRINITY_DN576_c0_g1_i5.p2  ORF type:complete len:524 (+),score=144.01 TRINITY_DN576_c0_g1_i5:467-2038(+)